VTLFCLRNFLEVQLVKWSFLASPALRIKGTCDISPDVKEQPLRKVGSNKVPEVMAWEELFKRCR